MNLIVLSYFTKKWLGLALGLLLIHSLIRGSPEVTERTVEKILQDDKTTFTPTSAKSKNHPSDLNLDQRSSNDYAVILRPNA